MSLRLNLVLSLSLHLLVVLLSSLLAAMGLDLVIVPQRVLRLFRLLARPLTHEALCDYVHVKVIVAGEQVRELMSELVRVDVDRSFRPIDYFWLLKSFRVQRNLAILAKKKLILNWVRCGWRQFWL